jgi:hypothetical protein
MGTKKVSEDLILRVKALAERGLSSREIGHELLITRNKVIGIAARYGKTHDFRLARQEGEDTSPKNKRRRHRKKELPRPSDTAPLVPGTQVPTPGEPDAYHDPCFVMMPLVMVHDGPRCHYPVTEGRAPYLYCGAPTDDTFDTYCRFHARLCTNTTPRPMPNIVYDW